MRGFLTIILGILLAAAALAQQEPPGTEKIPESAFFSGSVITTTPKLITVYRKGLGSNAATKTFKVDSETKIEGKLRIRVNVTVRFVKDEDQVLRAVHIIVR